MVTNKNCIDVRAEFDSGQFLHFLVTSTKNNSSYIPYEYKIQNVEKLTFEDFTALEIVIGQAVSNFLEDNYLWCEPRDFNTEAIINFIREKLGDEASYVSYLVISTTGYKSAVEISVVIDSLQEDA